MSLDEHSTICTANEERADKCTSQEANIVVNDGSKQGEFFGVQVFFFALNLDSFHCLKTLKSSESGPPLLFFRSRTDLGSSPCNNGIRNSCDGRRRKSSITLGSSACTSLSPNRTKLFANLVYKQ